MAQPADTHSVQGAEISNASDSWTKGVLLLSLATFAAAVTAAKFARDAAVLSKARLRIANTAFAARNRAWIKVEGVQFASDYLSFKANGGTAQLRVTYRNIGKSVARNIACQAWLLAEPLSVHGGDTLAIAHSRKCAEARRYPGVGTLFQSEGDSVERSTSTNVGAWIDRDSLDRAVWPNSEPAAALMLVGGVVTYNIAGDDEAHQTTFSYGIRHISSGQFVPVASGIDIPAGEIEITAASALAQRDLIRIVD